MNSHTYPSSEERENHNWNSRYFNNFKLLECIFTLTKIYQEELNVARHGGIY
jgi:hypothetical protein